MENTINRKEYRREYQKNNEINARVKKEPQPIKPNLLLNKIINMMLLLLSILLLKFFEFEEALVSIKNAMNSGIEFSEIQEYVVSKVQKIVASFPQEGLMKEDTTQWNYLSTENVMTEESKKEVADEVKNELITEISDSRMPLEAVNKEENMKANFELALPLKGILTSGFGSRNSDNPMISAYHTGVDIATNQGSIIVAAHEGVVTQAGENGSYGNSIMITSGDLVTLYGHCSSLLVKEGDSVVAGQEIAKVGMTGNATGPHLHFEVRVNGNLINPQEVIDLN